MGALGILKRIGIVMVAPLLLVAFPLAIFGFAIFEGVRWVITGKGEVL